MVIEDKSDNFPANAVYILKDYNQLTNIVSYASGMRQRVVGNSQGVLLLDNSRPLRIPPDAELEITNASAYTDILFLSVQAIRRQSGAGSGSFHYL